MFSYSYYIPLSIMQRQYGDRSDYYKLYSSSCVKSRAILNFAQYAFKRVLSDNFNFGNPPLGLKLYRLYSSIWCLLAYVCIKVRLIRY